MKNKNIRNQPQNVVDKNVVDGFSCILRKFSKIFQWSTPEPLL